MLGIRVTRAADEWICLAALACQPFIPPRHLCREGSRLGRHRDTSRVSGSGEPGQDPAENLRLHPVP